jgi:3-hydroxyacyl-CoA dehydrogenase
LYISDFFSPANIMQLLEVVRGKETSGAAIQSCMTLGKRLKKTPILAGNCFGFIGNRMLDPYLREAQHLVEEGASPAQVDRVIKKIVGFAMGPFEMSDLAGIDIGWQLRRDMTAKAIKYHEENPEEISEIKTQPSMLPEQQNPEEPEVFTIRRPIVLSDWYSTLSEKFCAKGYLGQKSGRGFYLYNDPLNKRKPSESLESLQLIDQHRKDEVSMTLQA